MKTSARERRRKPIYFTLEASYEGRMRGVEAASRRPRAELAREWAQERLDLMDFPCLEFRSNSTGRFAFVRGTRLAVWHLALLARTLGWGKALATHLEILPEAVSSALGYCQRHQGEIDALIDANRRIGLEQVRQKFPRVRPLDEVPA